MGDSGGHPEGLSVSRVNSHGPGPKKRPKLTFINPSEWADLQPGGSALTRKDADRYLCQRLIDRQSQVKQEKTLRHTSEFEDTKPRRKLKPLKSKRGRPRKRPIDPKRPWIESDDEDGDYVAPLDDESDDDDFLQRLAEEKEREEAEEIKRKKELQRQRRLKREERRSRATGRPGRPRIRMTFAHLYANSNDDPQSPSKPSETSDGEQSPLNDYAEEEEAVDFPLPPATENDNFDDPGNEGETNIESTTEYDSPRLNAVILRRRAPPLTLLVSSQDLICPSEHILDALSIYQTLRRYGRLLRLSPFQFEDFLSALLANENSDLLAAVHIALLHALITEDEANGTYLCPPDCKDGVSLLSFLMDRYTWPYLLSLYLSSIKRGEFAALEALSRVGNTVTVVASGPTTAVTFSGGADAVVTSSLFYPEDGVIPLDQSYPFVGLSSRIAVLRGLTGLFLATGLVRADILREGFAAHDDFCRVCRQSGEVLCCDTCPAVFHLTCLTPPLDVVPNSSWHCPLCETEQAVYGEKKVPKARGETRISPLGYDRAGRAYWYLEGRLFVEPVNFAQREPNLPGLLEGLKDEEWERLEAEQPTGDDEDEESDGERQKIECGAEVACAPWVVYANEPSVYYYSSLEAITAVRQKLSAQWESALCVNLDVVISQIETREQKFRQAGTKLESKESFEPPKKEADPGNTRIEVSATAVNAKDGEEDTKTAAIFKWPSVLPLPPALTAAQLTALFSNSQSFHRGGGKDNIKTSLPMENPFVLELSGGVLVHNQDGLFENFPLPPDVHVQRLSESRPVLVKPTSSTTVHSFFSRRWRSWVNTLSQGLFVPNPTTETGEVVGVNIALSRPQQHDEREKRRQLANKFCLSDNASKAWRWLDAEASADMIRRAVGEESFESTADVDLANRRADAVGPLRWLHTMKLTLCFMESQLPAAVLCPVWRLVRKDWLAAVLKATSVNELADLLARLEATIRPVAFQRTWTSSIGLLQLDRFTSAQREEEKRNRALERSSGAIGAPPTTLVRTKTIRPIRHTVWKMRGEEYRRLGGDGWQWVSATRRQQFVKTMTLHQAKSNTDRSPHLGLGWGVKPELLAMNNSHSPFPEKSTFNNAIHPITGVPLCQNVLRCIYTIPPKALQCQPDGVINISNCLSKGGGDFYPPPVRSQSAFSSTNKTHRCGREYFRLDSLLAIREAAASRDQTASKAASGDLDQLCMEREAMTIRVAEIRSRLATLTDEAQVIRTEHAKAVKARQTVIAELKNLSEQRLNQTYFQGTVPFPSSQRASGGGGTKSRTLATPECQHSAASRRFPREEYNYESGESAESNESTATSSSRHASSATESNLRRSSRRQKTKYVDPDFVVDFGEDEEEESRVDISRDVESRGFRLHGSEDDVMEIPSGSRGGRGIPQFDGAGGEDDIDDDDDSDMIEGENEDYRFDKNSNKNFPEGKLGGLAQNIPAKCLLAQASTSSTIITTGPPKCVSIPSPAGKSLLALAIEGKNPCVIQTKRPTPNCQSIVEPKVVGCGSGVTVVPTSIAPTSGGQPVRLVRVLRAPPGAPAGTQIIQALDPPPASTCASGTGNLIIPASTEPALQKSLIQLSSSGGVIVTQTLTLPAGYRLITPSSLPLTNTVVSPMIGGSGVSVTASKSAPRMPLNFVQVVSAAPSTCAQGLRPRPLVPQPLRPGQSVTVTAAGVPSLISIAPSPVIRAPPLRPLLAPASRPILPSLPNLAPVLRPRMVRVVSQPMQLDPSLDQAVTEAALKLHQIDLEIFNLRKELKHLESQLAELSACVENKEALMARCDPSTASPYSLSSPITSLLARLNRAVRTVDAATCADHQSKGRSFLHLPKNLPSINPYAWPPDSLFRSRISTAYPDIDESAQVPVPNIFRLSRANLRALILAAGRKEMSGYEAEKKRLASIPWSYPTSRPCFAEAWRFRLRQIILQPSTSNCDNLNTPSHYGVTMASLAMHLRLLWHSLRWDDIVLSADACEDATFIADKCYFKQSLSDSHGSGYTLRRVVAIEPQDKHWLRANFLIETTIHKPAPRKRVARDNSRPALTGNGDVPASRRSGRGNKRFADPDYDPAVDEGWRVGIPCSNRRRRRTNYNEDHLMDEDFMDEDDDTADQVGSSCVKRDVKRVEEWVSEETLQFWEIRSFFDHLLPIDSDYPPLMPMQALAGLPASLVEEASSVLKKEVEDGTSCRGSWIQPARCLSLEAHKPASPKPPSPPPPPPPPPSVVVMDTPKPTVANQPRPSITPSASQPAFRPLIVNSNHPQAVKSPLTPALHQHLAAAVQFTPSDSSVANTAYSAPRRTGNSAVSAPLSPKSEAARARARSLAASHAARISAANRRFRNEKAALDTRVATLVEELANRRRLSVKLIALQVQEEIIQAKRLAQREAMAEPTPPPLSAPLKPEWMVGSTSRGESKPSSDTLADKTETTKAGRGRGIARQQPLHSPPRTPPTSPATDSDEAHYSMISLSKQKKRWKIGKLEMTTSQNTTTVTPISRKCRGGRSYGSKRQRREEVTAAHPSVSRISAAIGSGRGRARGRGGRGASRKTHFTSSNTPATKPRLPIRTPKYLLEEASKQTEKIEARSRRCSNDDGGDVTKAEDGNVSNDDTVYCLCRKPYDPSQAYVGCDLCQDWFHFTCVGLESGAYTPALGDSWLCPECQRAEDKTKNEVYCLCRTPYDPTRVYIACDKCDEWYHAECVDMEPETAAKHEGEYICPVCTKKAADASEESEDVKGCDSFGKKLKKEETQKTLYEAPLTKSVKMAILELFDDLKSHKLSWPFLKPLPLSSQQNPASSMNEPTDLVSFKAAFDRGVYQSLKDLSFAGNYLFSNARLVFDSTTTEFHCAEVLEAFFLRRMKEVRSISERDPSSS